MVAASDDREGNETVSDEVVMVVVVFDGKKKKEETNEGRQRQNICGLGPGLDMYNCQCC